MINEEGYIKFSADWEKAPPPPAHFLEDLIAVRSELYKMRLIGMYPGGVGYGNISKRWDQEGRFVISGTATGGVEPLSPAHFTMVESADIANNLLHCAGPVMASSESMSHAAVYRQCPEVNGVIHIHSAGLWERWLEKAPTTPASAAYGTPEMAFAIMELLEQPQRRAWKFFVMGGHREGCIAFGSDLWDAFEHIRSREKPAV